jgi:GNAT superfamily N-acetyltransferase
MIDIFALDRHDAMLLKPILKNWESAVHGQTALEVSADHALQSMVRMIEGAESDVLAAMHKNCLAGIIGVYVSASHVGPQIIGHECLFYVYPQFRGAGIKLIIAAEAWAKSRGAMAMIMNASAAAGSMERADRFFSAKGYSMLERSRIKGL